MLSSQIPLTFVEIDLVTRIVVGCTKIVYRYRGRENEWCDLVRKAMKTSDERLIQLYVWENKLNSQSYFSPKDIEMEYLKQVGKVDHAAVSRSLKKLFKVKKLCISEQRRIHKGPGRHNINEDTVRRGPISLYRSISKDAAVREFVKRLVPRGIIYSTLYGSDVLTQYLKFQYYSFMMRYKYLEVGAFIKALKSKTVMDTKSIEEATSGYLLDQNFVRNKSEEEILKVATKLAQKDLISRNWENDELYTEFFVQGEHCYEVMEVSNL